MDNETASLLKGTLLLGLYLASDDFDDASFQDLLDELGESVLRGQLTAAQLEKLKALGQGRHNALALSLRLKRAARAITSEQSDD